MVIEGPQQLGTTWIFPFIAISETGNAYSSNKETLPKLIKLGPKEYNFGRTDHHDF
jgi:hypothetical protein